MQYAIQIPFEGKWLYITEEFGSVRLFDSFADAEAKSVWLNNRIVEYKSGT